MRKRVLLGVTLGGTEAFQGWWGSTFYEFDPMPFRSRDFSVSRLTRDNSDTEHLFNDRARLLRFNLKPSGVAMMEQGKPSTTIDLWARRVYSAPFIHDEGTVDRLYWYLRAGEQNTSVIITEASPSDVRRAKGLKSANTDINASSPIYLPRSQWSVPLLGLTRQKKGRLQVCGIDELGDKAQERCADVTPLLDERTKSISRPHYPNTNPERLRAIRLFHSAPLVTDNHLIVLERGVAPDGGNYSETADAFELDLSRLGQRPASGETVTRVVADLPIRESDEPVAALPDGASPPVLISAVVEKKSRTSLYEFDLATKAERRPATIKILKKPVVLSRDWISRPVLVMKPSPAESAAGEVKSRLVMSHAHFMGVDKATTGDRVSFNFLVLARMDREWRVELGAQCTITYTNRSRSATAKPCLRGALDSRNVRIIETSTAATQLLGAQLLAGYPKSPGALTLAIHDQCFPSNPIILDAKLDSQVPLSAAHIVPRRSELKGDHSRRIATCDATPMDLAAQAN